MKLAFVFPGQGSQSVGMLSSFDDPAVNRVLDRAGAALGQDLESLIANGPAEDLNLTVNTQPAMLVAGYAVYEAWRAAGGAAPVLVAGHSLGEYTALTAAGALALDDAVRLVRFRASAMQEAVPVGVGAMAAILGLADDDVRRACETAAEGEVVEAVNFNAPSQVVIAGHKAAVERACEAAKKLGAKRALLLPVSAPFHSSLLQPAAERLRAYLATGPDQVTCHCTDQQCGRRDRERSCARRRCACAPGRGAGPLGRDRAIARAARASHMSSSADRAGCWRDSRGASRRSSKALPSSTPRA